MPIAFPIARPENRHVIGQNTALTKNKTTVPGELWSACHGSKLERMASLDHHCSFRLCIGADVPSCGVSVRSKPAEVPSNCRDLGTRQTDDSRFACQVLIRCQEAVRKRLSFSPCFTSARLSLRLWSCLASTNAFVCRGQGCGK
mgnify:CR=1 FL=1